MSVNTQFSVSVVIPAYNAEGSIRQAINSVLNQTHQPDEIIVVDDGSTDSTAEIVKTFQQVTYIYQDNAGVSAACNTGIKNASCQWIAFIDSDDLWFPEKLEKQISLLRRNSNLKWVMCNYNFYDCQRDKKIIHYDLQKAGEILNGKEYLDFFEGIIDGIGWVRSCSIIERDVLEEAGMFRFTASAEDLDLCIRIALNHPNVGFVISPQTQYHFRREGSISSRSFVNLVKVRCQNLEFLLELSEKDGKRAEFERVARKLLINWSRGLLEELDESKSLIAYILHRHSRLLPIKYKIELRIKTGFPRAGRLIFKLYFKLKRILGGFGER